MTAAALVASAASLIAAPSAFAVGHNNETDYNGVLTGAPLPSLCEQQPAGAGSAGNHGQFTNCVIG